MKVWGYGLLGLALTATAAGAANKESCRITGDIVAAAVKARLAGKPAGTAKAELAKSGVKAPFDATIDPLVDMVYGLSDQGVHANTASEYKAQCLKY